MNANEAAVSAQINMGSYRSGGRGLIKGDPQLKRMVSQDRANRLHWMARNKLSY